jgi:predicted nuclease with RNAse H fold
MCYKVKYPVIVKRDREEIKNTVNDVTLSMVVVDAIIEELLSDAYHRGKSDGIDTVLSDPNSYDLFSGDGRDG